MHILQMQYYENQIIKLFVFYKYNIMYILNQPIIIYYISCFHLHIHLF